LPPVSHGWAAWRQDGDTAARWSTDLDYRTRVDALTALLGEIQQSGSVDP
jgi:hypothetical protein